MAITSKILTISVAAYNVADTIEKCLDSCVACQERDWLEVIVVNDGSTDNTVDIVANYESKYPGLVRLVCKENGGYGSTVNASKKLATGRYFRLLDGDDWVDSQGLDMLIRQLATVNVDLAIAPFVKCGCDGTEVVDQANPLVDGVASFESDLVPTHLSMHSICYRTDLLQSVAFELPEHRLYTDTLYNVIPLQLVKTAFVTHRPVYQYRVGRLGQSVSQESLAAHYLDLFILVCELFFLWQGLKKEDVLPVHTLKDWLVGDATWLVRIMCNMGTVPVQELFMLLDTLAEEQEILDACISASQAFRAVAQTPRVMLPVFLGAYHMRNRIKDN